MSSPAVALARGLACDVALNFALAGSALLLRFAITVPSSTAGLSCSRYNGTQREWMAGSEKKEPQAVRCLGFLELLPQYLGLFGRSGGVSGDGGTAQVGL